MAAKIRLENWDVETRLAQLGGLTRSGLIKAVQAAFAQHSSCTDNDPPNAKGIESWRWGVRRLREVYRPKGWDKDDTNGFSTLINHKLKIRIAVMNADDATGSNDPNAIPQNRSRKGIASERAAASNQRIEQSGFSGPDWEIPAEDDSPEFEDYTTWHLCIYIAADIVRAELSRLHGFEGGYFTDCLERIIILGEGDWEKLDFRDGTDDLGPEFSVEVTRK